MRFFLKLLSVTAFVTSGLVIALGSPASAEEPKVEVTHVTDCGFIAITVAPNEYIGDSWLYGVTVKVGDEVLGTVLTSGLGGPKTEKFELPEDAGDGSVDVTYYLTDSTEWNPVPADLNYQSTWPDPGTKVRTVTVKTDCEPNPTPTVTEATTSNPTPTVTVTETATVTPSPKGLPPTGEGGDENNDAAAIVATGAGILLGGLLLYWLIKARRERLAEIED